ncbi:MAG: GMC family oxidoreductase N-terminal domain-containing protein [Myxococcaceae bacterium]|nr:GMC family oxidoreductase N-terminal domain-containing protein [Myxococcaceae bacterium]
MSLSPAELAQLEVFASTVLPAGQVLPAAGRAATLRAADLVEQLPGPAQAGFRALLKALDARALLSFGSRFRALPLGRRVAVLEALDASEATHLLLRALLAPVKLGYFGDRAVWEQLGCRFEVQPPKVLEHARWRDQHLEAVSLADGETLECDVVIVGTGAGGAPLAHSLARNGHAVLLLEEGPFFSRKDFTGRSMETMRRMYRNAGVTVAFGNTAIPVPIGRGVGGTTLINSGTCFRVPSKVLADWREAGLQAFTDDALSAHYEEVERFLEVGPSSKAALGKPAQLIAKGCDALGYAHHPLRRNAPGCDGQGLCCFGCPTDAKRSMNVSYVPAALDRGAQLLTGFKVERLLVEGGAAVGVEGLAGGGPSKLTVRAKVVVLACGTLMTPVLLQRNGLCGTSGELGRNLSIHPASAAIGVFGESLDPSRTVPQGYAIDEFAAEGLYFEGGQAPLDLTAVSLAGFGPSFTALMEQFDRAFGFGFMVKDSSRGRVTGASDGSPRLTYWLNDRDLAQVRRGFGILSRVYFAAGAKEVRVPVRGHERLRTMEDVERLERSAFPARHVDLTAYHPLGTARMGVDPLRSVVDGTHETHDVTNLFICDGSAVPSSLGVNPQLTIMAMSLRAAEFVSRRLETLHARGARRLAG